MKWQSHWMLDQVKPNTCGDVAIKSLLNYWYQRPLFHRLIDFVPQHATLSQLQRFGSMFGLQLKAFKVDHIAKTKAIRTPFIVLTQTQKTTHYQIIQWENAQTIATVSEGRSVFLSIKEFQHIFTGYLMHSESFHPVPLPEKVFFTWNMKHVYFMQWIQVFALFIFTLLFFFISLGLPIDLFTIVLVMMGLNFLFYHSQWLIGLKQFDKNLMRKYRDWITSAEQYRRFHQLKLVFLKPVLLLIQSLFNAYILWFYAWLMDESLAWFLIILVIPYALLSWRFLSWSQAKEDALENREKNFFQGNIQADQYEQFQQESYHYLHQLQMINLFKFILMGGTALSYLMVTHSLSVYALTIIASLVFFWTKNIDTWIQFDRHQRQAKQLIYEFIIHRQS